MMTPEERDRLAVLETKVKAQAYELHQINEKLDTLIAAANMGKGAWWAIIKIGGGMVVVVGGLMWMWDRIKT